MTSPTRTLSYARVSTHLQTDGYSLESQRIRAAEYARYKGWPEPIHFSDEGVSGLRRSRLGMDALLATIRPGDTVLVKDVYRVGRGGAVQTLGLIHEMERRGATIVFLDQNIDTGTALGRMILTILAGFSELELEQTKERSLYGKLQAAKSGNWPSAAIPFGYRKVNRKLEPDPMTAPIVQTVFALLAEGHSFKRTAAILNERGIPNPRRGQGQGAWGYIRVYELYLNPMYVGRGGLHVGREWVEIPTTPLVSEEVWAAAHDRPTTKGGKPVKDRHPLVGHLRCPHGAPWNGGEARGNLRFYQVGRLAKQRWGCPKGECSQIGRDDAEGQARALLAALLRDPSDPAHLNVLTDPAMPPAPDPLDHEREEIKRQLSNLATLQVNGAIDLEDYMRLRTELKAREASLKPRAAPERPVPAPMLALADLVEQAQGLELAEILAALDAHFVNEGGRLRLARVTRLT